ncbi:MAG: adenosylmethionine--8-amino-7-oxononanoate transaminase [Nannocystis sp.]|uniref:adenosylmethionine--8-amino-7-oxononanoate transaminase n=1 Tax=Nannocystis sp. TaxID=1962667 RepID=UPI002424027A|nr:adenosylmethionine--8-amino-7-oxononanoate transaminase [Nannocystis sp.]MBK9753787.1 adenosylmethionine--8-amino-7-oxononanoate transaminase [Nannocystis sp.]
MANRLVSLRDRDRAHLWHPATHFADLDRLPPIAIERALGCWLYDESGGRLLDAIASWWTCVHGHGHPAIVAAIRAQSERLDHVMFAGFTHAPAVELAESLLELAPPGLGKVFFADCGSAAVEVALKLSYQRHQQIGEPRRRRFATLRNSYHGETLGALALCGSGPYRDSFAPLLFDALELPAPAFPAHRPEDSDGDLGADTPEADAAVALLEQHAAELSAVVIEPLVQCAGRMTMTGTGFYRRLAGAAHGLGIDVIADEIAVGFGRTGRLFASSWAGVTPDFLCLSKGLAGVLPLAAVLIRAGFEDAFTGAPSRSFLHSHTFTANPITCAAALAGLRLFRDGDLLARLPERVAAMATRREAVTAACPAIVQQRQIGMISAFQVDPSRTPADGRLGLRLRAAALERGVLLRPLHDTIYWLPPLVIDDAELDVLADVTIAAVHAALA